MFVLSVTAVLTAWCGCESSKWGGEMSIDFSQASSARIQATDYDGQARDARQIDVASYLQWIEATADELPQRAQYYEDRFTPTFAVAFDAWEAGDREEAFPFVLDEYVPEGTAEAAEMNATPDARFADALKSNQRGDNYSLLTVLFALVLFLTAMSQRNNSEWAPGPSSVSAPPSVSGEWSSCSRSRSRSDQEPRDSFTREGGSRAASRPCGCGGSA
ncbi:hypothetical protein [Cryobacterium psychrophilum]|uniref:hypothetical protein n=1 Tax=Cryobacterium psychrophilum TaxID=41988 RepID=UPI001FBA9E15|nr:hypothetical protein [Cryobacterium psychrophilum]